MIRWLIGAGFLLAFVALFLVMRGGWRARARRQSDVPRPPLAPADLSAPVVERDLFYVATSRANDPLDRIVVSGLGFRARAVVSVHAEGVVLDIAGGAPILLAPAVIRDVGRATWTIDRVVESDGLIRIGWRLGDVEVDTYLRDNVDPRDLIEAIDDLIAARQGPAPDPAAGPTPEAPTPTAPTAPEPTTGEKTQ